MRKLKKENKTNSFKMCLDPGHHVGQWGRGGGPMFSEKRYGDRGGGGIQRDKILKRIAIARTCATFHPLICLLWSV